MVRIPTNRIPTHPSEMLLEEFLVPVCLTQRELFDVMKDDYQTKPKKGGDLRNHHRSMF